MFEVCFWSILIIFVGGIALCVILENRKMDNAKKQCDEVQRILDEMGFKTAKRLEAVGSVVFVDEENKEWCFYPKTSAKTVDEKKLEFYSFADILKIELQENGQSIYKSEGVLGRAAAGGLVFGVPGTIIGGSTAKKKEHVEILKLSLLVYIRSIAHPTVYINLLSGSRNKNGWLYSNGAYKNATEFVGVFNAMQAIAKE